MDNDSEIQTKVRIEADIVYEGHYSYYLGKILILLGALFSFSEVSQLQETWCLFFSFEKLIIISEAETMNKYNKKGISTSFIHFKNLKEIIYDHQDLR